VMNRQREVIYDERNKVLESTDLKEHVFDMEYFSMQHAKMGLADEPELRRSVALVTGAGGAIGTGICRELLENGCHVAVTDLPGDHLNSLVDELKLFHGERVCAVPLNVTDKKSVAAGFGRVVEAWGGIDLVVINAGLAHVSSLADMDAAVEEFDRAITLPGIIGAIVPGNAFMTFEDAEAYRPLLGAANRHRAVLFVHWGPRPGDQWPRIAPGTDNMARRMGTIDMQYTLSQNMVTFCMTEILDDYPDALIHIHNLGGNVPYEIERMDHRCLLDTPDEPLPSKNMTKPNLYMDCNSFGANAIELGVELYGADKILFGTDGTEFGAEWSNKAVAGADIGDDAKKAILHGNAVRTLSHLATFAALSEAAE